MDEVEKMLEQFGNILINLNENDIEILTKKKKISIFCNLKIDLVKK